ncbi:MAG: RNA 3'-terminal phosphate cyclase [Candidatus Woesearchaeota archaeon]
MIELDGSYGEGGGQILRTALALSTVTKQSFTIKNIRANRPQPGLKAQHLETVRAFLTISNAKAEGATIGSTELSFKPGTIENGEYDIRIGTAGSITLVLQALLPAIVHSKKEVLLRLRGGTDVKWSPSWDYTTNVLFPILHDVAEIKGTLRQRGYYPKGDGLATVEVKAVENPKQFMLTKRGKLKAIRAITHANSNLRVRSVSERIASAFTALQPHAVTEAQYSIAASIGAGITAWVEFQNCVLGVDELGDIRTHSEVVGERAAKALIKEIEHGAPVDTHMADQMIPWIALFGGEMKIPELTKHAESNIYVVEMFMKGRVKQEKLMISCQGTGLKRI